MAPAADSAALMIAYDILLDGLPERLQELFLRLRDMVLSLGTGIHESVEHGALEFRMGGVKLGRLSTDDRSALLLLYNTHAPPLQALCEQLTYTPVGGQLRLTRSTELDDPVRRVCREAYQRVQQRTDVTRVGSTDALGSAPALEKAELEALQNLSRGLRLWMHQLEVARKSSEARARQEARVGQKRSHKKRPPPLAPPLFVAQPPPPPPPQPDPPPREAGNKPNARRASAKAVGKPAARKPAAKAVTKKKPKAAGKTTTAQSTGRPANARTTAAKTKGKKAPAKPRPKAKRR